MLFTILLKSDYGRIEIMRKTLASSVFSTY